MILTIETVSDADLDQWEQRVDALLSHTDSLIYEDDSQASAHHRWQRWIDHYERLSVTRLDQRRRLLRLILILRGLIQEASLDYLRAQYGYHHRDLGRNRWGEIERHWQQASWLRCSMERIEWGCLTAAEWEKYPALHQLNREVARRGYRHLADFYDFNALLRTGHLAPQSLHLNGEVVVLLTVYPTLWPGKLSEKLTFFLPQPPLIVEKHFLTFCCDGELLVTTNCVNIDQLSPKFFVEYYPMRISLRNLEKRHRERLAQYKVDKGHAGILTFSSENEVKKRWKLTCDLIADHQFFRLKTES